MPRTEAGVGYLEGSETSEAGAEKIEPSAPSLQTQLVEYITTHGSTTQDEFALHLGRDKCTVSPRFAELEKRGLIEKRPDPDEPDKFIKRKSSTGVNVWVYFLGDDPIDTSMERTRERIRKRLAANPQAGK